MNGARVMNLVLSHAGRSQGEVGSASKDIRERVIVGGLPPTYKVFMFYLPSMIPDENLRRTLEAIGNQTGGNLLVTFVGLDDDNYDMVSATFGVRTLPSIVMTAVSDLALAESSANLFVSIDHKPLLDDRDRLIPLLEQLYLQFLNGEVAEAAAKISWTTRSTALKQVGRVLERALRAIGDFLADRDFSLSLVNGTFEMRRSGGGNG